MQNEPVNVYVYDSASANIGALRADAFAVGAAPFLSFIDDDDWVAPGAFNACLSALRDPAVVGAYTDWTAVCATGAYVPVSAGSWKPLYGLINYANILHTKVFRREPTMRLLDGLRTWDTLEEAWLVGMLAANGRWQHVPVNGHFKRVGTPSGAGSRITSNHLYRYQVEVGPILRAAHVREGAKEPL